MQDLTPYSSRHYAKMFPMESVPYDFEAVRKSLGGRCFICEMLDGNPEFRHHVFYEDELAVAFLDKYPALYGYSIVAPKRHVEHVTADFQPAEYLALQEIVYRIGEAVRRTFPTQRLYILSLGRQQGNRHVHWHVAPLPPGVPFDEQQCEVLMRPDRLKVSDYEMAGMADRLREAVQEA